MTRLFKVASAAIGITLLASPVFAADIIVTSTTAAAAEVIIDFDLDLSNVVTLKLSDNTNYNTTVAAGGAGAGTVNFGSVNTLCSYTEPFGMGKCQRVTGGAHFIATLNATVSFAGWDGGATLGIEHNSTLDARVNDVRFGICTGPTECGNLSWTTVPANTQVPAATTGDELGFTGEASGTTVTHQIGLHVLDTAAGGAGSFTGVSITYVATGVDA
jgi:hypothetical protein